MSICVHTCLFVPIYVYSCLFVNAYCALSCQSMRSVRNSTTWLNICILTVDQHGLPPKADYTALVLSTSPAPGQRCGLNNVVLSSILLEGARTTPIIGPYTKPSKNIIRSSFFAGEFLHIVDNRITGTFMPKFHVVHFSFWPIYSKNRVVLR